MQNQDAVLDPLIISRARKAYYVVVLMGSSGVWSMFWVSDARRLGVIYFRPTTVRTKRMDYTVRNTENLGGC